MFPRLIMAQDPFDFDCHGLDGETTHQGAALSTILCRGCFLYPHTGGVECCSERGDTPALPYSFHVLNPQQMHPCPSLAG